MEDFLVNRVGTLCFFTLVALLSGCVTSTRIVDLAPPDYPDSAKAMGGVYIGEIVDNRTFEQKPRKPSTPSVTGTLSETPAATLATLIGRQRNGYGKAMGDVALPAGSTVARETRDLLSEGLRSRGYILTDKEDATVKIDVSVNRFWGWFTPGMWVVSFETQIGTTLDISTSSGDQKLDIEGYGINRGQVASDANWRLAFDRGFADYLEKLDAALDKAGL